ncbi:MAG: hypothetical protein GY934_13420 [Gammaproteobacteria bacterium]|nr:hypothetical protein [Gammaproteobacteria bacterium]
MKTKELYLVTVNGFRGTVAPAGIFDTVHLARTYGKDLLEGQPDDYHRVEVAQMSLNPITLHIGSMGFPVDAQKPVGTWSWTQDGDAPREPRWIEEKAEADVTTN